MSPNRSRRWRSLFLLTRAGGGPAALKGLDLTVDCKKIDGKQATLTGTFAVWVPPAAQLSAPADRQRRLERPASRR